METIFVLILFGGYAALWELKRRRQKALTGVDPDVLRQATTPTQHFFYMTSRALTAYVITMILLHASGLQYYSLFSRYAPLNRLLFDCIGFVLGLLGLSMCCYAQIVMGRSWRVGIDDTHPVDLITVGLYRFIRNPTYLGLFILSSGVWLIWPTWTIFIFGLLLYLMLEVQVRCEEEYLERIHGERYKAYRIRTKRYVPGLY